jgi:hypothetical protein
VQRLCGNRLGQVVPLALGRTAVDREDRRGDSGVGHGDRRGLEQREVRGAAADVARDRAEQAGQQGRRHQRLLAAQRVGQAQRRTTGIGCIESEPVEVTLPDEGEADHLDVARPGERAADTTPHRLLSGQTAARRRRGQHARDAVVADDPGDLLDEVEGIVEVGTPRRHRRGQRVGGRVDDAADRLEVRDAGVRGDVHAGDPRWEVDGDRDRPRLGSPAHDRDSRLDRAAAVLREQLGDPVGRSLADRRVDTALVALAGLGGELVAPTGAEHGHRVPVRRLDQHARGGRGHLRVLPAHDAAEPDDPGVVGDDQVLVRERPVVAVEGGEPLALPGTTHPDRTGELVRVVPVDGAAELVHDVVGHVDGERDRSLPHQHQPTRHPARCGRGGVEPGDRAGDEDRAALGVVDHDRIALVVGHGGLADGGVVEGHAVGHRGFARDPTQRQRVGAVGVDLELDDLVAQVEEVEHVVAGPAGIGRQHEDPIVVLAEPELLGGADHPGGEMPVGLAGGDLEASGEHPTGQHDDHEVAGGEVVRPAHDALRLTGAVGSPDVDLAPVDGLAVLLRLGLHRQDAPDHQRAGDVVAGTLERLELEPERGQPRREVLGGDVGGQAGVLADPGDRRLHDSSDPKASEKRTSPSNMSRMSSTPWRNIRVRSMPIPKAKPV